MKITAKQLRRIIKEEAKKILKEEIIPTGPSVLMPGATYAVQVGARKPIKGEFETSMGMDDNNNPVVGEFFFNEDEPMLRGSDQLWVTQDDVDNGKIFQMTPHVEEIIDYANANPNCCILDLSEQFPDFADSDLFAELRGDCEPIDCGDGFCPYSNS